MSGDNTIGPRSQRLGRVASELNSEAKEAASQAADAAGEAASHAVEAGKELDVHAGCPNLIERIEGGLLSYGNDMTAENTPHECGLGKFCNTHTAIGCVGRDALLRVAQEGPIRQIRAIEIDGPPVPGCDRLWQVRAGEQVVGRVSSATWSPDFDTNVAIGMIRMTHWNAGTELAVELPDGTRRDAVVKEAFWL